MDAISKIPVDDDIVFQIVKIAFIREDVEYSGFRVSLDAIYDNINAPLSLDITTGDKITSKLLKRTFKSLFNDIAQFK